MAENNLKQMIEDDIREVFLNNDEFASLHYVEGKEVSIILSSDQNIPLPKGYTLGITENTILIYGATEDIPYRQVGGTLNIDNAEYTVESWDEDVGMSSIKLRVNQ